MENTIIIENVKNFNVKQTLECGQVFRFKKISEDTYDLMARDKKVRLRQNEDKGQVHLHGASQDEYEEIWKHYFDLETDYEYITETLAADDEKMKTAIDFGRGIRILNQDSWEMLISFIISQNNSIGNIQRCIENISKAFGTLMADSEGEDYYAFPSLEELSLASEEELRACKVGFRAPYIMDACDKVKDGTVVLDSVSQMTTEDAKEYLKQIKGVGDKVAHCVLLFGLEKEDTFPTDVWIKRIMQELYFDQKETKNTEIMEFAMNKFKGLAGYAQQYLFYYARQSGLDKKLKAKK